MAIEVVIPSYNAEKTIEATIQSVLMQTEPVVSITIVDDGSTDRTEAIVRLIPGVKFMKNEKNLGAMANWNRCVDIATADHVAILHADDIVLPHWHRCLKDLLLRSPNPEETLLLTGYADITPSGDVTHVFQVSSEICICAPGEWLRVLWQASVMGVAGSGATIYARRPFKELGGFPGKDYPMMADIPLHFRLAQRYPVAFHPEPLAMMTQFPNSLSKGNRPTLYVIMLSSVFPYVVISYCKPYLARLKAVPDDLFTQPRQIFFRSSVLVIARMVINIALRVMSLRLLTLRYRPRLAARAKQHARELEEIKVRRGGAQS